jgi:predicted nuclease of predicted toxin-antitoxin system
MRVLIDECLDWRLCRALTGHYCVSVQKMGWSGFTNGALLEKAEQEFDVFVTGDRNLSFQQDVAGFNIALVILSADSTQLSHTLPLMPKLLALLPSLQSGQIVNIAQDP